MKLMEILQFLFSNFGKTFLILVWLVCGITAIFRGTDPLGVAAFVSICYGIYRWLEK